MFINRQIILSTVSLVVGIAVWASFAQRFNNDERLAYKPNIACIKGSPYGKILALAMQGSIDFYWHKGRSHESTAIMKAEKELAATGSDERGSCADGTCDHDHSSGGHDFSAADHSLESNVPEHEHGEGCGCPAHRGKNVVNSSEMPMRKRVKAEIAKMSAWVNRNTSGKPRTPMHEKYIQGVTEDKLRLAYELDPTNYTNYGNYHLFLSMNDLGKSEGDPEKALKLAKKTLAICKKNEMDPTAWLTAASAAYNIVYHIGRNYESYSIPEAKASLAEFDFCMERFQQLVDAAALEGRIPSQARYDEMNERVKFLNRLRKDQGVYMKRMMTKRISEESK